MSAVDSACLTQVQNTKAMPGKYLREAGIIRQFKNCQILRDHVLVWDDLWVRNGKILNPEKVFYEEQAYADVQVDCGGSILAPGFIDTQINGAFGVDFSRASADLERGVNQVAQGLLAHGVTSFCPTVITLPPDQYKQILPKICRTNGGKDGAGILGLHLEGPFISREKCGAHPPEYTRDMEQGLQDLEAVYGDLSHVSIVTLAPELPGASDVIGQLVDYGVTVSLGHSMANLKQGEEAIKHGASFITHLFNAMLPFHHRDPHLVGLLASDVIPPSRTVFYGMIADGIHTHPAALRIARRTHADGLVLVTDAIPAMGLALGTHHIGVQVVEIREGGAFIAGTNTLCGSIATMSECVKYFYNATESTRVDALEAASLHPAQMLGIAAHKGSLAHDSDADFVVLDNDLNVEATFIAGDLVWQNPKAKQLSFKSTE